MLTWSISKLGHVPADGTDAWEVFGRPGTPSEIWRTIAFNVTLTAVVGDEINERAVWTTARAVSNSLRETVDGGGSAFARRNVEGGEPRFSWTVENVGHNDETNQDLWQVFGQPEAPGKPLSTVIFNLWRPAEQGDERNERAVWAAARRVAESLRQAADRVARN